MSSGAKNRRPLHLRFRDGSAPGSLPLWSIFLFAAIGLAGALTIAFLSKAPALETLRIVAGVPDVPVYSARPVPFDLPAAAAPTTLQSVVESEAPVIAESARSADLIDATSGSAARVAPAYPSSEERERLPLPHTPDFPAPSFTIASAATALLAGTAAGVQSNSSGFAAPDAETFDVLPVPEPSTILSGIVLGLLVIGRWIRATWHRRSGHSR